LPSHDDVLAFIKRQDTPIHSTDVAAEFGIDNLEAIDLLLELHNLERIEQHHRNDGRGAILWVTR
jgi:hypothetical protein